MKNYHASLVYCITSALSAIYISDATNKIDPFLSLLICVTVSTIFFHIVNIKKISLIYHDFFKTLRQSINMNISATAVWVLTFLSLAITKPYIFIETYFVVPAIISYIIIFFSKKNLSDVFIAISLVTLLSISIFIYLESHDLFGIIISILAGISAYLYRFQAKKYSLTTKSTPSMVLCVRSYGIIAVSLIFTLLHRHRLIESFYFSPHNILLLCTVIVLSFIVPLYFNQKGVKHPS